MKAACRVLGALALVVSTLVVFVEHDTSAAEAETSPIPPPKRKSLGRIEYNPDDYVPASAGRTLIKIGNTTPGTLSADDPRSPKDGTPMDLFEFTAKKGEVLRIDVQATSFDPAVWTMEFESGPLLLIAGDSGKDGFATARMVVPRTGKYLLAVNYSHGQPGGYEMKVEREKAFSLPSVDSNSTRRAVLIGIGDYPGRRNDLTAPVHDVDAFRNLLVSKLGFAPRDILDIKGPYATRENILKGIHAFLGSLPDGGMALLYYSGHGTQVRGSGVGERERDKDDESLFLADGSYLVDHELRAAMKCIDAERVIVIVDACYSGGIYRAAGAKRAIDVRRYLDLGSQENGSTVSCLEPESTKKVDLVISASQEDERAWEYGDWNSLEPRFGNWEDVFEPRSMFTNYLIEALRDASKEDFRTPVRTLVERVSSKTTKLSMRRKRAPQNGRLIKFSSTEPSVGQAFGLVP